MKASFYTHRLDYVIEGLKRLAQLGNAFAIGPQRRTCEYLAAGAHYVSAVESSRLGEKLQRAIDRERLREALCLRTSGWRSHHRDDCDFVKHQCGVFNKDRVRELRFGRERDHANAELPETILIGLVLRDGEGYIDRLSLMI
jgi:hypothetical protein